MSIKRVPDDGKSYSNFLITDCDINYEDDD